MMPCFARLNTYDWLTVRVPVPLVIVTASAVVAVVTASATAPAAAMDTAMARVLDPNIDNHSTRELLTGQQRMASRLHRDQIGGATIAFSPHAGQVNAQPTSDR